MFRQIIRATPFTSRGANELFRNMICSTGFNGDQTFISTIRALVAPRIGDDTIRLSFASSDYGSGTVGSHSATEIVGAICGRMRAVTNSTSGEITIHNFIGTPEGNKACIEVVKSHFTQVYGGWHLLQKVTDFYRKSFDVLCFINPERKNVALFVDSMDVRKMHYLQCSIFAFLPWYFDPESGVSEIEMELINSLREKTPDKYENCLSRMAEQYDFRSAIIRQLLTGFESEFERRRCDALRRDIQCYVDEINQLNSRIGEFIHSKSESEIQLLGLETKLAQGSGDSEIMEYFLCNERLTLETVNGASMDFICADYLTYFDEDMAKRMIDNDSSYVYRDYGGDISAEDMKKLMSAVFIDQTLRMKFCASYHFEIDGGVSTNGRHTYGHEFREYMPNPHIDRYNCMGNYTMTINQLLANKDYIGAIEQCIASCKSLNFGDSTVMVRFMQTLCGTDDYETNNRCIELPNGTVVTPEEAIEWLNEQEEHEDEEGVNSDE